MFYFGLNNDGFINTHIFDQKISNFTPARPKLAPGYPWLRKGPEWTPDLIKAPSLGCGREAHSSKGVSSAVATTESEFEPGPSPVPVIVPQSEWHRSYTFTSSMPSLAEVISFRLFPDIGGGDTAHTGDAETTAEAAYMKLAVEQRKPTASVVA